ncbi:IclR family transcriptional regulator [Sphingobium phenoxybenzoativorans]|uniref:IclR family transcriptional regulator n=1 Tax=Sphingobium phenoxybenzoativorans TaxID=1592790 RepID=UPI000871F201|nr:IclR family transcriptional regulator [Sphingobium phenoxybenzoativorans]
MKRRVRSQAVAGQEEDTGGRQFITALSRGLDVLRCFRYGEEPLTNQEIARRTGLPRPTISRIVYTLRELGYLAYFPNSRTYGLGGSTYILGEVADHNFDPVGTMKPIMQRYAESSKTNIGLSTRDRLSMVYVEAREGASLVGLQLRAGDKISLTQSAIGLAYLAGVNDKEYSSILRQLKSEGSVDMAELQNDVASAKDQLDRYGFILSLGKWRAEIHGATVPVFLSKLRVLYVLSSGGPAYMLPEDRLRNEVGPLLLEAARDLKACTGT